MQLAKQMLGDAYDKYAQFIGLIPEIEERIRDIKKELEAPGDKDVSEIKEKLKLWEKVLKDLEHVRDRPKAMKLYYTKKVLKQIKKIKEKYPG